MSSSQLRLRALVQACKKKEYTGKIYAKNNYWIGRQIDSEYAFEGNWWYVWLKKGTPVDRLQIGDVITTDIQYRIDEIHFYKNYKRGTVLLSTV